MEKVQMSTGEAIRLLAQAIINIDEGHETVKKDSPIYNAMRNIIDIEGAARYLELGWEIKQVLIQYCVETCRPEYEERTGLPAPCGSCLIKSLHVKLEGK